MCAKIITNFSTNPNRPNCITIGIYSDINMEYVNINEFNYKDKFEKIVVKSIFEKSKKNSHIYYFDKEKENDTFRSINFENEKGAFGYLVIENKTKSLKENNESYDNVSTIMELMMAKEFDFS